jgi:hypothetical protein
MSGFKNAPGVTEFRVGMRISGAFPITIIAVDSDGCGWGSTEGDWKFMNCISPNKMGEYTLDLASVWVGRFYAHKEVQYQAEILVVSDKWVGVHYSFEGVVDPRCMPLPGSTTNSIVSRRMFLSEFRPLPLDRPAEMDKTGAEASVLFAQAQAAIDRADNSHDWSEARDLHACALRDLVLCLKKLIEDEQTAEAGESAGGQRSATDG